MRRLCRAEVERRLLEALDAAPTAVMAEVLADVYPELMREVEATRDRLAKEGRIVLRYRRWTVKRPE